MGCYTFILSFIELVFLVLSLYDQLTDILYLIYNHFYSEELHDLFFAIIILRYVGLGLLFVFGFSLQKGDKLYVIPFFSLNVQLHMPKLYSEEAIDTFYKLIPIQLCILILFTTGFYTLIFNQEPGLRIIKKIYYFLSRQKIEDLHHSQGFEELLKSQLNRINRMFSFISLVFFNVPSLIVQIINNILLGDWSLMAIPSIIGSFVSFLYSLYSLYGAIKEQTKLNKIFHNNLEFDKKCFEELLENKKGAEPSVSDNIKFLDFLINAWIQLIRYIPAIQISEEIFKSFQDTFIALQTQKPKFINEETEKILIKNYPMDTLLNFYNIEQVYYSQLISLETLREINIKEIQKKISNTTYFKIFQNLKSKKTENKQKYDIEFENFLYFKKYGLANKENNVYFFNFKKLS